MENRAKLKEKLTIVEEKTVDLHQNSPKNENEGSSGPLENLDSPNQATSSCDYSSVQKNEVTEIARTKSQMKKGARKSSVNFPSGVGSLKPDQRLMKRSTDISDRISMKSTEKLVSTPKKTEAEDFESKKCSNSLISKTPGPPKAIQSRFGDAHFSKFSLARSQGSEKNKEKLPNKLTKTKGGTQVTPFKLQETPEKATETPKSFQGVLPKKKYSKLQTKAVYSENKKEIKKKTVPTGPENDEPIRMLFFQWIGMKMG